MDTDGEPAAPAMPIKIMALKKTPKYPGVHRLQAQLDPGAQRILSDITFPLCGSTSGVNMVCSICKHSLCQVSIPRNENSSFRIVLTARSPVSLSGCCWVVGDSTCAGLPTRMSRFGWCAWLGSGGWGELPCNYMDRDHGVGQAQVGMDVGQAKPPVSMLGWECAFSLLLLSISGGSERLLLFFRRTIESRGVTSHKAHFPSIRPSNIPYSPCVISSLPRPFSKVSVSLLGKRQAPLKPHNR